MDVICIGNFGIVRIGPKDVTPSVSQQTPARAHRQKLLAQISIGIHGKKSEDPDLMFQFNYSTYSYQFTEPSAKKV